MNDTRIDRDRPIHGTDVLGWAPDAEGLWHRVEGILESAEDAELSRFHTACGVDVESGERSQEPMTPTCEECARTVEPPNPQLAADAAVLP